jgi:hypothetical protein
MDRLGRERPGLGQTLGGGGEDLAVGCGLEGNLRPGGLCTPDDVGIAPTLRHSKGERQPRPAVVRPCVALGRAQPRPERPAHERDEFRGVVGRGHGVEVIDGGGTQLTVGISGPNQPAGDGSRGPGPGQRAATGEHAHRDLLGGTVLGRGRVHRGEQVLVPCEPRLRGDRSPGVVRGDRIGAARSVA